MTTRLTIVMAALLAAMLAISLPHGPRLYPDHAGTLKCERIGIRALCVYRPTTAQSEAKGWK